jgi:hypothetical protein
MTAKLDARAALCGGATQAGTLEIVGTVLDVRAKLLRHVVLHLGTMKKLRSERTKVCQ